VTFTVTREEASRGAPPAARPLRRLVEHEPQRRRRHGGGTLTTSPTATAVSPAARSPRREDERAAFGHLVGRHDRAARVMTDASSARLAAQRPIHDLTLITHGLGSSAEAILHAGIVSLDGACQGAHDRRAKKRRLAGPEGRGTTSALSTRARRANAFGPVNRLCVSSARRTRQPGRSATRRESHRSFPTLRSLLLAIGAVGALLRDDTAGFRWAQQTLASSMRPPGRSAAWEEGVQWRAIASTAWRGRSRVGPPGALSSGRAPSPSGSPGYGRRSPPRKRPGAASAGRCRRTRSSASTAA